jgi:hypothetical protein
MSISDMSTYSMEREKELICERDMWMETAAQHWENEKYYRSLVVQIGQLFGKKAQIADDGSDMQEVLCAKVPELVENLYLKAKILCHTLRRYSNHVYEYDCLQHEELEKALGLDE